MQNDPSGPRDKAQLLERIQQAWTALEQTIGRLSDEQMTAPEADGGWSVKDHLAHITAWEQYLLAVLEGRPLHEVMGLDEARYRAIDTDGLNVVIFERDKDRPLPEVLATFRQSHEQVLAALARLTDPDLFKPFAHYQPGYPDRAFPVINSIIFNTYDHYQEHRAMIQALTGD
jgi:hypothetical protein